MVKVKAGFFGELTVNNIKRLIAFEGGEIAGGDYELEGRTEGLTVGELLSLFPGNIEQVIPKIIADIVLKKIEIILDYKGEDAQKNKIYDTYYSFEVIIDGINILFGLKLETGQNRKSLFLIIKNPANPSQPYLFNLYFNDSSTATDFIAIYSDVEARPIPIKTFVESVSPKIASYIPDSLSLKISNVIFAYSQENEKSKFLFGLDIGGSIDLSDLPLVGQKFPSDRNVLVAGLRLLIASENFIKTDTQDQVQPINKLLPPSFAPLPPNGINKGVNVAAQINFGSEVELLDLSLIELPEEAETPPEPTEPPAESPTAPVAIAPSEDKVQWFNIQKTFGPVDLARVGVLYKDEVIWFLLDASLSVAGLTLALDGAAIGSPLTEFKPRFKLQGISIEYESAGGVLTIGGAFLKSQVKYNDKPDPIDVYSGAVVIRTEELGITGLGSYMEIDGHPSLFVYAVLDQPLGGPAFFFVTGLALGFGYNRTLVVPTLDEIPKFPLVQAAIEPTVTDKPKDAIALVSLLKRLQTSLPPRVGQIVLAVGIKFTSFKIIDSFALLVATFGDRFALYLIGTSVLVAPPRVSEKLDTALAQVNFALIARFIPAEGIVQVEGKILPGSYVFARECRLTGGFAFYSWFSGKDAGDFVLTVGGYHPAFKVPGHYPNVDRLGLNWQITPQLSLKGNVYFALTASALMAGGRLEAVWRSGNLKAWFIAEAHFLIAWRPYFYDARISVNIGASYTFKILGIRKTISIDVGANLHIWGPEFSGIATVDLSIVSFTVRFGSNTPATPPPLDWEDFKASFLPKHSEVCAIAVQSGLLRSFTGKDQKEISVVNPSDFTVTTSSAIPIKTTNVTEAQIINAAFGIAPMNLESGVVGTFYEVTVTYRNLATNQEQDITSQFNYRAINKQMPTAMWGQSQTPKLNGTRLINLSSGIEVSPKTSLPGSQTPLIDQSVLRYDTESADNSYNWQPFSRFQPSAEADEELRGQEILNSITQKTAQRRQLFSNLGFTEAEINGIDLTELTDDINQAFEIIPQLEAMIP